jgi:hypothetical protein
MSVNGTPLLIDYVPNIPYDVPHWKIEIALNTLYQSN